MAVVLSSVASAQTSLIPYEPPRFQAGFGGYVGIPLGDFAAHVDPAGGVSGFFDMRLADSVISLGGEVGYLSYGREKRDISLAPVLPDIPDAGVTIETTNDMWLFHGRVRAQPRAGRWRPYADGLFGLTDLVTKTAVKGAIECTGLPPTCEPKALSGATNSRDVVFSFGAGAGVMIGLSSSPGAPRLDISGRYIRGHEATYLTEGAVHREGDVVTFDFSRSRTDIFALYIGIAIGR